MLKYKFVDSINFFLGRTKKPDPKADESARWYLGQILNSLSISRASAERIKDEYRIEGILPKTLRSNVTPDYTFEEARMMSLLSYTAIRYVLEVMKRTGNITDTTQDLLEFGFKVDGELIVISSPDTELLGRLKEVTEREGHTHHGGSVE